jgi:hypothetical protein
VIDGELVCLDGDGRPQFYDLLRRRGPTYFYAFDLIECDGQDLEGVVAKWKYGRYCCGEEQPPDRRLTLHASNPAAAARLTWLKIRNPDYSQMLGRDELFKARAAR